MEELHDTGMEECPLHSLLVVSTPGALVWASQLPLYVRFIFLDSLLHTRDTGMRESSIENNSNGAGRATAGSMKHEADD